MLPPLLRFLLLLLLLRKVVLRQFFKNRKTHFSSSSNFRAHFSSFLVDFCGSHRSYCTFVTSAIEQRCNCKSTVRIIEFATVILKFRQCFKVRFKITLHLQTQYFYQTTAFQQFLLLRCQHKFKPLLYVSFQQQLPPPPSTLLLLLPLQFRIAQERLDVITQLSKKAGIYEILANSVAPSVYEHEDIKKGF